MGVLSGITIRWVLLLGRRKAKIIQASTEFLQGESRNSAVNAPMKLSGLTTKSVHILTKDLKGPLLANLRDSFTTWSKPKGYLDRIDAI
ncbi:Hypothetical protein PHPALM_9604 [Phytophthora palmivora]|uniref:Uncharacterized protein n=1 Tax=Phytophthora palmivora TaxID=4796 RepID=A0A2P4Y783_9STRA|nr:Hypothetical protein PHPALM_9604 [Phytophthora palmivora]